MKSKTIEVPRELLERVTGIASKSYDIEGVMIANCELRALLAAPEAPRQSEPVAWMALNRDGFPEKCLSSDPDGFPVYRAPLSPDHSGGAGVVVLPEPQEERMRWMLNEDDVIAALEAAGVPYERKPRNEGCC